MHVVCRYACLSDTLLVGSVYLCTYLCESDFINKARIINPLPIPSYRDYWDL